MRVFTFVEIDIDFCQNTYGESPCTAAIGTTGDIKCFNSLKTCQDRENYIDDPVTLRFAMASAKRPADIDAIPSIKEIRYTPATVSLGKDLGQRATVNVVFRDHPFADTGPGFDKYVTERDYNPYEQGTFFGKFRARHPFLRGRALRLILGEDDEALADMETHHYIIDSFDGPTPEGEYTLVAKDVLKLADGDRAQAPKANTGFLASDLTAGATSATLSPSGIGDDEYAASGYVAIGGSEICSFTRSGNSLTLGRGKLGTSATSHSSEDRVQTVLHYDAQDVADIISDLEQNYADVPSDYIPLDDWQTETDTFLGRLYTATIPEPTGVDKLIAELIEQAALAHWWDDSGQKLRLQVLRGITTDVQSFSDSTIMEGTLKTREQPDTRLSRVQTYYGQIDPLRNLTEASNYRSMAETVDADAEDDYGSQAIKKVFSRWIPAFGRSTAQRLNAILLSRFRDPPRRFDFALLRGTEEDVGLGQGARLSFRENQDETGAAATAPIQITQLNPKADRIELQAEEMLFSAPDDDLSNRVITIDSNSFNLNWRTIHDQIFPEPESGITVTCVIGTGIVVGSTSTGSAAFDTGTWPDGVTLVLDVAGRIQGRGGKGGLGGGPPSGGGGNGNRGGVALLVRSAISLDVADGEIWGGGGGGGGGGEGFRSVLAKQGFGGGGGGGGSGTSAGGGGVGGADASGTGGTGNPGSATAGGVGGAGANQQYAGTGGKGGGPGLAGSAGQAGVWRFGGINNSVNAGTGGAAGAAINGVSLVTFVDDDDGDTRGPQIN